MTGPRHFLDLHEIAADDLRGILDRAAALKQARPEGGKGLPDDGAPLAGKVLAMIFEKPSTRTRVSFDMAMRQLGGGAVVLNAGDMQLGRGETIADTARVLSRYVDGLMVRTDDPEKLVELAAHATVPVINGLTDATHPCQLMADILTFEEHRGPIAGRTVAWVGDGNNVAATWVHAAARFGFALRLACPDQRRKRLGPALSLASGEDAEITLTTEPLEAVKDADCVVTDIWVSMGDNDAEARRRELAPYQVNAELMAAAKPDALFMHDLPAHRGEEVTGEIIDGPQSVVWDEAENRLHAQKGILDWCFAP